MTDQQRFKKLYDGKFFYEVVKTGRNATLLVGPLDNVRYIDKRGSKKGFKTEYKFAQIISNKVVHAFKANEILVLTKPL